MRLVARIHLEREVATMSSTKTRRRTQVVLSILTVVGLICQAQPARAGLTTFATFSQNTSNSRFVYRTDAATGDVTFNEKCQNSCNCSSPW
jgi:hypothetical protein